MHGTRNIVFVILTGIGALLVAIPLPKALASGNVGTSMLIIWTELACLVQLVNAIRWNHNIENSAPAWCDFCSYFLVAADVALAASNVSINRRLYMIVTLDPRRHGVFNIVFDIALCLVIPCAVATLLYVVQQYRFYILEDIGCLPGIGNVDLSFPLVWMLPLFAGTVSTGYACLTIRAGLQRNDELAAEAGGNSAWSHRLLALGLVSTMYGLIPTSMAIALLATAYPVIPWPGWRAIHSTTNIIAYVPALEWQSTPTRIANAELRRWTIMTLAFVIFMFLGLTADMKRVYRAPFRSANGSCSSNRTLTDSGRNADNDLPDSSKAPRWPCFRRNIFFPFGKARRESRHENLGSSNEPRSGPNLEGFQGVLPVSWSHVDTTELNYTSWKFHCEGGYPTETRLVQQCSGRD